MNRKLLLLPLAVLMLAGTFSALHDPAPASAVQRDGPPCPDPRLCPPPHLR